LFEKLFDIVDITGNTAKKLILGGVPTPVKKSSTGGGGLGFLMGYS